MYRELYRVGANEPGTQRVVTLDFVRESEARLLEAGLSLSDTPADRLATCEKDWEAKFLGELIAKAWFRDGRISRASLERSRFDRLDAELRLREAEQKLKDK
jgi:hypothetical protein